MVNGKEEAIHEAERLDLTNNRFYSALLGRLYTGVDNAKAHSHLTEALSLARTPAERSALQKKIDRLLTLYER